MRRAIIFVWLLVAISGFSAAAQADKRVALVIGNGEYRNAPQLANPINDATDVAKSFKNLGFAVTQVQNGGYDAMRQAIGEFEEKARGADLAVVFYAGHGMEVAGENWLIPVDAKLLADTQTETQTIPLRMVIPAVSNTTTLGLIILDACRNNPFTAKMQRTNRTRAVDRGFARIEPSENVLVAYAAKDGTTAADGSGRNSPFSQALLQHLEAPGLEIMQLFRVVRDDVMTTTKGQQQPFVYGSLSKKLVYFRAPEAGGKSAGTDEINWRLLKQAAASAEFDEFVSPQIKRAAEAKLIEQFLRDFPKGKDAPEAAVRLQKLRALLAADPPVAAVTEEDAAWGNLADVRSGKLFASLSVPQRLETENRGLEEFKTKFPNSRRRTEAEARLAELKILIARNPSPSSEEEVAWRALNELEAGKIFQTMADQQRLVLEASSLEEFIRRFPGSQHIPDARTRLKRLEELLSTKLTVPANAPDATKLADEQGFVNSLRAKPAQSLNPQQRQKLIDISKRRATLDLEIPFDYNSATIGPQAAPVLRALGRVLTQAEFKGATFLVGGHTDASGGAEYNLDLSQRRAEAVKRLLIDEFKLAPANFIIVGFGKEYPKNNNKPLADENRRVALVNMDTK